MDENHGGMDAQVMKPVEQPHCFVKLQILSILIVQTIDVGHLNKNDTGLLHAAQNLS